MPLLDPGFMAKLAGRQLGLRKVLAGRFRGERRSRQRGRSVEFADHREYAYGDDVRFLDWRLLGRLDKLFLKLFQDEEELRVHILIDASASMGFGEPSKFDQARRTAAALAYVGLSSRNRVKVVLLSEAGATELPWQRGIAAASRIFSFLEAAVPAGRNALAKGVGRYVGEARPSGLVILLSDLLDRDGAIPILRPLVRPSIDAWAIQILSPEELSPDVLGDFRLIDSEERDGVDVAVDTALLDAYHRQLSRYLGEIEAWTRRCGMGRVLVDAGTPFEDLVLRVLREEGVLK